MAVQGVSVPGASDRRKPSMLENIAMGVDIAAKVLGTGVDVYKTFGVDIPKARAEKSETEARTKLYNAQAADEPGNKDLDRRLKEAQVQYYGAAKAADLENKGLQSAKNKIELKQAQEVQQYGKPLSQNTIETLSSAKLLPKKLADINEIIDKNADLFGPVGGTIGSINPYDTKAQTISGKMRTSAQEIGKYLEGGVLRKEDEAKYQKMLPQLGDTSEVAKNKAAMVQKMLFDKFMSDYTAFKESGFDTRAFDSSPMKQLTQPEFLQGKNPAAPAQAPAIKPPTVIQNGIQYNLNPQTGEYE
jgi:hypothetical protein